METQKYSKSEEWNPAADQSNFTQVKARSVGKESYHPIGNSNTRNLILYPESKREKMLLDMGPNCCTYEVNFSENDGAFTVRKNQGDVSVEPRKEENGHVKVVILPRKDTKCQESDYHNSTVPKKTNVSAQKTSRKIVPKIQVMLGTQGECISNILSPLYNQTSCDIIKNSSLEKFLKSPLTPDGTSNTLVNALCSKHVEPSRILSYTLPISVNKMLLSNISGLNTNHSYPLVLSKSENNLQTYPSLDIAYYKNLLSCERLARQDAVFLPFSGNGTEAPAHSLHNIASRTSVPLSISEKAPNFTLPPNHNVVHLLPINGQTAGKLQPNTISRKSSCKAKLFKTNKSTSVALRSTSKGKFSKSEEAHNGGLMSGNNMDIVAKCKGRKIVRLSRKRKKKNVFYKPNNKKVCAQTGKNMEAADAVPGKAGNNPASVICVPPGKQHIFLDKKAKNRLLDCIYEKAELYPKLKSSQDSTLHALLGHNHVPGDGLPPNKESQTSMVGYSHSLPNMPWRENLYSEDKGISYHFTGDPDEDRLQDAMLLQDMASGDDPMNGRDEDLTSDVSSQSVFEVNEAVHDLKENQDILANVFEEIIISESSELIPILKELSSVLPSVYITYPLSMECLVNGAIDYLQYLQELLNQNPGKITESDNKIFTSAEKVNRGPKRPKNGFIRFSMQYRKQLAASYPKLDNREISRMLGAKWRKLSLNERKPFEQEFHNDMKDIREKFPEWKYVPGKKNVEELVEPMPSRLRPREKLKRKIYHQDWLTEIKKKPLSSAHRSKDSVAYDIGNKDSKTLRKNKNLTFKDVMTSGVPAVQDIKLSPRSFREETQFELNSSDLDISISPTMPNLEEGPFPFFWMDYPSTPLENDGQQSPSSEIPQLFHSYDWLSAKTPLPVLSFEETKYWL